MVSQQQNVIHYQLELHIQSKKYWFGVPWGPSWIFRRPKGPEISLKMSNDRLHLIMITKI
jgi:hypothetical protein